MKTTRIGSIDLGIDGTDAYYLIEVEESDDIDHLDPDTLLRCVKDKFLRLHFEACRHPGGRFCTSVLVTPQQYSDGTFIGTAHVRYDV